MVKISKDSARYIEHSTSDDECRDCKHFQVLAPRHCEAVEGIINADGWCRLFARKSRIAEAMKR